MICILKLNEYATGIDSITDWIIATDIDDARRQAQAAFDNDLAQYLYTLFEVRAGKTILPTGHIMLVSYF
jgi:hypothetical protein